MTTFNYPGFFTTWHQSEKRYAQDERRLPVIPADFVLHDEAHPFCNSATCDCHDLALNGQTFIECIEQPILDGLLTTAEGLRLYWGEQV